MEKKTKTTEIPLAKWQSVHGMVWKQIIYLLSLQDLANLCGCSSILNSIGKVDRVPWRHLSMLMNANVRKAVWADQPAGLGQLIYRWFALHMRSVNMRADLLSAFGGAIITEHDHSVSLAKTIFSRLSSSAKYYFFNFSSRKYAMIVHANAEFTPRILHCNSLGQRSRCHPDLTGLSFSKLLRDTESVYICGDGDSDAHWLGPGAVREYRADGPESTIDVKTGLRKATNFLFAHAGPDDGYPTCLGMRCAGHINSDRSPALTDYWFEYRLNFAADRLQAAQCVPFDPKKLSIVDFK